MKVLEFQGRHRFLSNFYPCSIVHDGIVYRSTEHAYQASKTLDVEVRRRIADCPSPGAAKRAGRGLVIRADWILIRRAVMRELVLLKFAGNRTLRQKLLDTGDVELIEGNAWGDTFWGACNDVGQNHLGKILMEVRELLQHKGEHA